MARRDKRSVRAWIKVQLRDDQEAQYVESIIAYWKSLKMATHNVTQAIKIYYALTQGNIEPLLEEFPMLRSMLTSAGQHPTAPQPPPVPKKAPKKRIVEKSLDEDLDDFLSSFK